MYLVDTIQLNKSIIMIFLNTIQVINLSELNMIYCTQNIIFYALIFTVTKQWSKVIVPGNSPCSRRRHCCCVLGDKAIIFGGSR